MPDRLIRRYYAAFNERRLADAAALFTEHAVIEAPFEPPQEASAGYRRVAEAWIHAFPDGQLTIQEVAQRNETMCEVYLIATGTHRGEHTCGIYRFPPTGVQARLHLRELLDIRAGQITRSTLAIDLNDLIRQLGTVDYTTLRQRLDRIRALGEALGYAADDRVRQRDIADQLGLELDAARKALRPHFHRER
jgi:predicted ester cyclase